MSPHLRLPDPSLVLVIDASPSVRASFVSRHFRPSEVLSVDVRAALRTNHPPSPNAADEDAMESLRLGLDKRLSTARLTVIDVTHVEPDGRKRLVSVARDRSLPIVAIVLSEALGAPASSSSIPAAPPSAPPSAPQHVVSSGVFASARPSDPPEGSLPLLPLPLPLPPLPPPPLPVAVFEGSAPPGPSGLGPAGALANLVLLGASASSNPAVPEVNSNAAGVRATSPPADYPRLQPSERVGPSRERLQVLRQLLAGIPDDKFGRVFVLDSSQKIASLTIERVPLRTNLLAEHGPFDVIGDVHGCMDELLSLLAKLGYDVASGCPDMPFGYRVSHPRARRAIFLGDLVDRGPRIADVLRLVMSMVETSAALCVPGNHDKKLLHKLKGAEVRVSHGLEQSVVELDRESESFRGLVVHFLEKLVSHYVLDRGNLVVAHAGMKESLQGRDSSQVEKFACFGDATGVLDPLGFLTRRDWASEYKGKAIVVYGHTPTSEPVWVNRTINIDTGCVFGGKLTAFRYPELELVSVRALKKYYRGAG